MLTATPLRNAFEEFVIVNDDGVLKVQLPDETTLLTHDDLIAKHLNRIAEELYNAICKPENYGHFPPPFIIVREQTGSTALKIHFVGTDTLWGRDDLSQKRQTRIAKHLSMAFAKRNPEGYPAADGGSRLALPKDLLPFTPQ